MRKRLLALFLSLALLVSYLPLGVTAEELVPQAAPAPHSHADTHVCEDCKDGTVKWTAWTKTTELPITNGHYYLTGNVTVSKRWAVSGTNQVVLCLNGYTIDAGKKTAYEVTGTGKLVISDCTAYTDGDGNYTAGSIINGSDVNVGGAFYVQGSGQLYMYGGKLTGHNNTQTSTGMGWSGGAIHARGNAYVYLKDCEISGNYTSAEGGAICLRETGATGDTAASAYMENVTFKNNKADRKGGVLFLNSAKNSATMKNCTFEGNNCPGSGGVVYSNYGTVTVENCTFKENYCGSNGGIFNMYDGNLTITGGSFTGRQNGDSAKNGGLIYMNKTASVTINSGTFTGFTVSNLGGLAYMSENTTYLLIKDGTFSGNQARNGGVIAAESKAVLKITGGTIENNTATNKAGAVYVNGEGTTFILENAQIGRNTAPNGGGVYAETKAVLTLRSGKIVNNTVTGKGGGIYCVAGSTVNVSGSLQVSGNTTGNIYLPAGQVLTLGTMGTGTGMIGITTDAATLPCTFTTDMGTQNCSAYFFSDDADRIVTVLDNKLALTQAPNHNHCACANMGGSHCSHEAVKWTPWFDAAKLPTTSGHYYLETDVKLTGRQTVTGTNDVYLCLNGHTIDANKTVAYEVNTDAKLTVTDCGKTGSIVNGSNANVGGAFYGQGNGQLTVYGTTLSGHANTQTSADFGWSGGAVHGRGNAKMLFVGTVFENNTSTAEGGAVCLRGSASATFENCTFKNNTADRRGGAIYVTEAKNSLSLKNCTFEGNSSKGSGGAVFCSYGIITAENCTFTGNTATSNGGAFNMMDGNLTITGGTYTGKQGAASAKNGGLLYANKTASITINGGTFQGFQVSNLGGIAYLSESTTYLLIQGGTFSGNQARNGGAFVVETGATFKVTGGTIKNNTATNKAGGVYVNGTGATFILENAEVSGNTAPNGGGVYAETKAVLTLRSGKITGNTATGKGGGIYCVAGCTVNLSGTPEISNNTASNVANNIYLPGEQVVTLGTMGKAKIGITADATTMPRIISTDMGSTDCSGCFFSDDAQRLIAVKGNKLVLTLATDHRHCACANIGGEHCSHEAIQWTPWVDDTKLPTTSGHYYLETNVKISGRATVSGTNEVYLCLNGHTIDSNKKTAYEVKDTGKLTVTDCTGNGSVANGSDMNIGGAFYVQGNGQLTMFGGTLSGHANTQTSTATGWSGGAVHSRGKGKLLFVGTVFENNTSAAEGGAICLRENSQLTLEKVTFRNNTATRYGGAIFINDAGCTVRLTDCTFENNSATQQTGGAIGGRGVLEITGCRFTGNTAGANGGAIMRNGGEMTVTDSTFTGNTGNDGAAIRITDQGDTTITGCTFTENAAASNGGAISCLDSLLTITDSTFHGNTADKMGGAIFFQGKDRVLTLSESTFKENISVNGGGGAILVQSGADLQLKSGTFTDNTCKLNNGGAIYISTNSSMIMESGTIENNTGWSYGGGIYLLGASLTVNEGTFTGNRAGGGAAIAGRAGIRTVDGQQIRDIKSTIVINSATITGNVGTSTGALLINGEGSTLTIHDGIISENTAENAGGIIAETYAVVTLKGGKIANNTAKNNAGGIYMSYTTTLNMEGGEITGNTTDSQRGGGIFLYGSTANLKGGSLTNNKAGSYGGAIGGNGTTKNGIEYRCAVNIYDTLIQGNTAALGGGGMGLSGADILMAGGKITGNSTPKSCGGLLAMSGSVMKMTGGEITKNTAGITCGGLYMNGDCKFVMQGGSVSNNHSTNNGAGMYIEQGTADLSGGQISYNTSAKGSGGGAYFSGCNVTLRGTAITGNRAKTNGGGVVVSRYKNSKKGLDIMPKLTIAGSTISYNYCEGPAGGMVLMSPGVTNFVSGSIRNNETKGNGGGVYVSTDHTFNMSGGKIESNKANQGAGVYHLGSIGNYTGGSITKNMAAKNGGGMVLTNDSDVKMKDMQITENEGWTAGGIILNNQKVKFTAENCNISANRAFSGHGGALYGVWGIEDARLTGCTITNNYAEGQGGAIATANGLQITFTDCTFTGNQAGKEGGAVFTKAAMEFDGCTISDNTAGGNGGAICTAAMGSTKGLHPKLQITNCTIDGNKTDGQGGALYLATGSAAEIADSILKNNSSEQEGGAIWAIDDLSLSDMLITGNRSGGAGYALYYNDAEFDGHSYFRGLYKIDGQMIVKDNEGGDIYMGNQVALSTGSQGLTGDTYMNITLHSGYLTQLLYGAYDYEGGNLIYTVTAGDRSLTDPEDVPLPNAEQEAPQQTEEKSGDTWLYVGIGAIAVVIIAVLILILKKKKKPAEAETK